MKKNTFLPVLCFMFLTGLSQSALSQDHVGRNINTDNMQSIDKIADSKITFKIKESYIKEKLFGKVAMRAWNLHVVTINGIVYLTGTAKNEMQLKNAVTLAKKVKGVKNVDYSQVNVKSK